MKAGAEPKKVAILAGLGLVLLYLLYTSFLSNPTYEQQPRTTTVKATAERQAAPDISRAAPLRVGRSESHEFRPSLKRKQGEFIDPMQADPTLHLDLLAKVQAVQIEGGERNLFQFGAPPAPKLTTPDPKIIPKKPEPTGPKEANGGKSGDVSKPPPTPIPLKFYGFTSHARQQTNKRAFFLNGEEIIVAAEGDVINKRYKVIRIGVNSAVVEDTQSQHQQTLPLEEQG
jgi:hypothetical protein